MLIRAIRSVFSPHSFWREVLRYGQLQRRRNPGNFLRFRFDVTRLCAAQRQVPRGLPTKAAEDVFPGLAEVDARIRFATPNVYSIATEELITIAQLVAMKRPKTIFEFGTFDGRTTLHLAINAPADAVVYTLDIISGSFDFGRDTPFARTMKAGERFLDAPERERIRVLTGDSKVFDFSTVSGPLDFIFVDADHSYAGVINDSKKAFDMVRPGGIIVWHDYLMIDDVTRALIELSAGRELIHLKGTTLAVWQVPA